MPGRMFNKDGTLNIPEIVHADHLKEARHTIINACYCPNGHNLVHPDEQIDGFPAIVLNFRDNKGEGVVAITAEFGSTAYRVVEGSVDDKYPLDLSCPECGEKLDVFGPCPCDTGALTLMVYLYPKRDPHQSIGFCNVLSCPNSALIRAGNILRDYNR